MCRKILYKYTCYHEVENGYDIMHNPLCFVYFYNNIPINNKCKKCR